MLPVKYRNRFDLEDLSCPMSTQQLEILMIKTMLSIMRASTLLSSAMTTSRSTRVPTSKGTQGHANCPDTEDGKHGAQPIRGWFLVNGNDRAGGTSYIG